MNSLLRGRNTLSWCVLSVFTSGIQAEDEDDASKAASNMERSIGCCKRPGQIMAVVRHLTGGGQISVRSVALLPKAPLAGAIGYTQECPEVLRRTAPASQLQFSKSQALTESSPPSRIIQEDARAPESRGNDG